MDTRLIEVLILSKALNINNHSPTSEGEKRALNNMSTKRQKRCTKPVRIDTELHRKVKLWACEHSMVISKFIDEILKGHFESLISKEARDTLQAEQKKLAQNKKIKRKQRKIGKRNISASLNLSTYAQFDKNAQNVQ